MGTSNCAFLLNGTVGHISMYQFLQHMRQTIATKNLQIRHNERGMLHCRHIWAQNLGLKQYTRSWHGCVGLHKYKKETSMWFPTDSAVVGCTAVY
jgi:hypothetical protein